MKLVNFLARLNNATEIDAFYGILLISILACIGMMIGIAMI